jgi:hypothetical protein
MQIIFIRLSVFSYRRMKKWAAPVRAKSAPYKAQHKSQISQHGEVATQVNARFITVILHRAKVCPPNCLL